MVAMGIDDGLEVMEDVFSASHMFEGLLEGRGCDVGIEGPVVIEELLDAFFLRRAQGDLLSIQKGQKIIQAEALLDMDGGPERFVENRSATGLDELFEIVF